MTTLTVDGVARTLTAIDDALTLEFTGPLVSGGAGSGKSAPVQLVAAKQMLETTSLVVEIRRLRLAQRESAARFDALLAAAQAAVIEARTSRRNPITPITEVLAELGAMPASGARLHDLPLATSSAWPQGSEVES
jgi:hypothetical protein